MNERYEATIRWITGLSPGRVEHVESVITITHSDCVSSLWPRQARTVIPPALTRLDFYNLWDGADLFGSAFKLCSILEPKLSGAVVLVDTVSGMAERLRNAGIDLPDDAVPFMVGSGQWVYWVQASDDAIHEYDLEESGVSGEYSSIAEVVEEWARNVSGGA